MKIAVISKADSFGGGASRVAEELTCLLNNAGFLAHHFASWSGKEYNDSRRSLYGTYRKYISKAHNITKRFGLPEVFPFELPPLLHKIWIEDYDILHFHDLSSAISPLTLGILSRYKPVVWTIHDCSPFTGGCLYPMECDHYLRCCGNCPQIGEWPIDCKIDFTKLLFGIKRHLHKSGRITLITPSNWMADTALRSGIISKRPLVISNGVDTNLYKPRPKNKLRRKIGIPTNRPIILLSAGSILDERKGTYYAIEALRRVKDINPFLLVVGNVDDNARRVLGDYDYFSPGYISDFNSLSELYGAADIFLFCSLADNQPLVVLETMAVGTPIVGFKTGGIPEMVDQGKTGFLVNPKEIKLLSNAIRNSFNDNNIEIWSKKARQRAVSYFSHEHFIKNHIELYDNIINNKYLNQ